MEPIFEISESFYQQNEQAFFLLIHNTYVSDQKMQSIKGMAHLPETEIYEHVFKEHPNKQNLKIFFAAKAIQHLW